MTVIAERTIDGVVRERWTDENDGTWYGYDADGTQVATRSGLDLTPLDLDIMRNGVGADTPLQNADTLTRIAHEEFDSLLTAIDLGSTEKQAFETKIGTLDAAEAEWDAAVAAATTTTQYVVAIRNAITFQFAALRVLGDATSWTMGAVLFLARFAAKIARLSLRMLDSTDTRG